jgi:bifunctional non-homologous end joining protein LigD
MSKKEIIKVGKYEVPLTNLDKVLLPKNITKGDIIDYYIRIAPIMLPLVKHRPIMMQRFPEGLEGEFFYQKDASAYFPDWIKRERIPKEDGSTDYVVIENEATIVYLANQACLTTHLWLSRIDKLHFPDRLIFDLDPSGKNFDFNRVREIALAFKKLLDHLGLISFVMTTGSRGLHVVIPLDRRRDFIQVKNFSVLCAHYMLRAFPHYVTLELRKQKRGTKIFIDTLRNQFSATAVSPFSIRAKEKAPIATPLHWDEVADKSLFSQKYNISNIFNRLDSIEDPWKEIGILRQSLTKAEKQITQELKKLKDY